mmetsp:Transcript_22569/g.64538  ORF Transcript_22569/g.64538 Transcript_22569/m.64538 type:complete len:85 (-) Transcript_22569:64-318(-)
MEWRMDGWMDPCHVSQQQKHRQTDRQTDTLCGDAWVLIYVCLDQSINLNANNNRIDRRLTATYPHTHTHRHHKNKRRPPPNNMG